MKLLVFALLCIASAEDGVVIIKADAGASRLVFDDAADFAPVDGDRTFSLERGEGGNDITLRAGNMSRLEVRHTDADAVTVRGDLRVTGSVSDGDSGETLTSLRDALHDLQQTVSLLQAQVSSHHPFQLAVRPYEGPDLPPTPLWFPSSVSAVRHDGNICVCRAVEGDDGHGTRTSQGYVDVVCIEEAMLTATAFVSRADDVALRRTGITVSDPVPSRQLWKFVFVPVLISDGLAPRFVAVRDSQGIADPTLYLVSHDGHLLWPTATNPNDDAELECPQGCKCHIGGAASFTGQDGVGRLVRGVSTSYGGSTPCEAHRHTNVATVYRLSSTGEALELELRITLPTNSTARYPTAWTSPWSSSDYFIAFGASSDPVALYRVTDYNREELIVPDPPIYSHATPVSVVVDGRPLLVTVDDHPLLVLQVHEQHANGTFTLVQTITGTASGSDVLDATLGWSHPTRARGRVPLLVVGQRRPNWGIGSQQGHLKVYAWDSTVGQFIHHADVLNWQLPGFTGPDSAHATSGTAGIVALDHRTLVFAGEGFDSVHPFVIEELW